MIYLNLDLNDLPNEVWKDCIGYEGLYQVSNLGRVKSLHFKKNGKERILRQSTDSKGYLHVVLTKHNERQLYKVHRLVLSHFKENPQEKPQCNHLNENRKDNRISNLAWCTAKENCNWGTRNDKISVRVVQLDKDNNKLINIFPSAHEAERRTGFHNSAIINCCKNKFNRPGNNIYKGYKWMYLKDYNNLLNN